MRINDIYLQNTKIIKPSIAIINLILFTTCIVGLFHTRSDGAHQ